MSKNQIRVAATAICDQIEAALRDLLIATPPEFLSELIESMSLIGSATQDPRHRLMLMAAFHGINNVMAKLADEQP